MPDLTSRGGFTNGDGTYTVDQTDPGVWSIFDPHGVGATVTARQTGSAATAESVSNFSADGDSRFIPAGVELTIAVTGLSSGEEVFVGRVAAEDDRHLSSTDLPAG